jgi:nucleoside-diphosphate-sugar epimerase
LQAIALDTTKAQTELGWTPRVDLIEGIARTIEWLHGALAPKSAELVGA